MEAGFTAPPRPPAAAAAALVALLLLAAVAAAALQDGKAPTRIVVRETLLAELPRGGGGANDRDGPQAVVSPDGRRVAFVRPLGDGREAVVLDGAPGKAYADVGEETLRLSPDGKRVAYVASTSGKVLRMLNSAVATNRHHGTAAVPGGSVFVVVDGAEHPPCEAVDAQSVTFSPDGARLAYLAQRGGRWVAVVDGKEEGREFDDIAPYLDAPTLHFSPDGRRLAYAALRREADRSELGYRFFWSMVRDGQRVGGEYDFVSGCPPAFSADGKRLAFVARREKKVFAVVDGEDGKPYDDVPWRPFVGSDLVFSPDGKRLAYVAESRGRARAVVDGVEGKEYAMVVGLAFSPDGGRLAYVSAAKSPQPGVATDMTVVVDGREGKKYFQILPPAYFSPDGRRVAFINLPRRRRSEGGKASVVADDAEGRTYRSVLRPLAFSPDGRHLAYRAVTPAGGAVLVVDGAESPAFDDFPADGPLRFSGARTVFTVARRGDRLYRLEADVVD